MTKLRCCFCQQELDTGNYYVHCHNPGCNITTEMEGTEEMWQELIRTKQQLETTDLELDQLNLEKYDIEYELERTRKALDVAVDALKRLEKELYFNNAKQTGHIADSVMSIPSIALQQITALEQKE